MAFAASAFQGSAFKIGSPLVAVDGVLSAPTMTLSKERIDVTAINDTSEQSIVNPLQKYSGFDLTVAYDKDNTQHVALLAAYTGASSVAGQLAMNDGETFTGSFYVLGWKPEGDSGSPSKRVITLYPAGAITIA